MKMTEKLFVFAEQLQNFKEACEETTGVSLLEWTRDDDMYECEVEIVEPFKLYYLGLRMGQLISRKNQ